MEEEQNKCIKFVEDLLKEREYDINYYHQNYFVASHKRNCWKSINVAIDSNNGINIYSDICLYSGGKSKKESIKLLSKMFDEVQKDIDFVNSELTNIYSTHNIIRMCKICGVPQDIIEKIENNLSKED